jgi:hypothetical protein
MPTTLDLNAFCDSCDAAAEHSCLHCDASLCSKHEPRLGNRCSECKKFSEPLVGRVAVLLLFTLFVGGAVAAGTDVFLAEEPRLVAGFFVLGALLIAGISMGRKRGPKKQVVLDFDDDEEEWAWNPEHIW